MGLKIKWQQVYKEGTYRATNSLKITLTTVRLTACVSTILTISKLLV